VLTCAEPLSPEDAVEFDGNFTYLMAGTKPVIAAINGPQAAAAWTSPPASPSEPITTPVSPSTRQAAR